MEKLTNQRRDAILELYNTGAAAYLVEQVGLSIADALLDSESEHMDRIIRARLENLRDFDGEIMAVVNMVSEGRD
jgi:hypothetical protein